MSISAWLVIAWIALHVLGAVMTLILERRLGFFPIWFFDCVACSASQFSLPYGFPVVGGMSWGAVAAVAAAGLVLLRGIRPADGWVFACGIALIAALSFHVAVTWPVRYPGSLPPLAVAVVLPFGAVLTGALGLFGVRNQTGIIVRRSRVSVWALLCLGSGVVSMTVLGGVVSVVAFVLCGWRVRSARPGLDRVLVLCGGVLAVLSITLRVLLRVRYPSVFGWIW